LGGQADRGRRAVRLYLEDRRDRGAPAARAPRRAADGRLTLRPDEARGLGLPARARQPQHRPRAADTRRAHGRDPGRSRLHAGGDRAVAPRRDYLSAGAAPIRASLAPTRAPAVASRSAKRASAGWRRAAVRQTRVTGSAGTRAGALTTRSAGASASARAGTNPMPSPPDTYESSSETLGTSMVDTGRTRASARYCSSTARPRLSEHRRQQSLAEVVAGRYAERGGGMAGQLGELTERGLGADPQLAHDGQRRLAGGGETDAAAGTLEEPDAEVGLDLPDLLAHRRRG